MSDEASPVGRDAEPTPLGGEPFPFTRAAYPPSFCGWRSLLGVAAVSLLSVALMILAKLDDGGGRWMLAVTVYGVALGLFCALSVCVLRAWLRRLPSRDAWVGAWGVVFVAALAFSYATGVVGTVLGVGPGREMLAQFMLKSVLSAGIVAIALLRYMYIRSQWQAETLAEAEARVQALQARIRPHFLFNSLNTIASLIHDNPGGAERATEDLADLFRAGMRRADQLIGLHEELELARKYLDMERRRLGDRLAVEWSVEDVPREAAVLPMILQPLLENAVSHGIQPRTEPGTVRVFGRTEGDSIVITVSNPLPQGSSGQRGHGMALHNIRARLALAFGTRAGLITNQDEDRFYAVLTVPHVENPDH